MAEELGIQLYILCKRRLWIRGMLDQIMIAREAARATEIRFMPGLGVFLNFPEGGGIMHIPEPLWQRAMSS